MPLLIAGGAVLAVGVVIAVLFATGVLGGGGPEKTARDFFQAVSDENCGQIYDLIDDEGRDSMGDSRADAIETCEREQEEFEEMREEQGNVPEIEMDLVDTELVNESDNEATVKVTYEQWEAGDEDNTEEQSDEIDLVDQDGWRVNQPVVESSTEVEPPDLEDMDLEDMDMEDLEEELEDLEDSNN